LTTCLLACSTEFRYACQYSSSDDVCLFPVSICHFALYGHLFPVQSSWKTTKPGFSVYVQFVLLCLSIYWCMCVFVTWGLVFVQYHAKWLDGKNISEMTYFCRVGRKTSSQSLLSVFRVFLYWFWMCLFCSCHIPNDHQVNESIILERLRCVLYVTFKCYDEVYCYGKWHVTDFSRFDCISSRTAPWSGRRVHTCTRMDT